MDVTAILSLELIGPVSNNLGYLVRTFPCRTKLVCHCVLHVLEDLAYHLASLLESSHSDVLIIVSSYLLLVDCSAKVSFARQLVDGIKIVIEFLLVGVFVEPLAPC